MEIIIISWLNLNIHSEFEFRLSIPLQINDSTLCWCSSICLSNETDFHVVISMRWQKLWTLDQWWHRKNENASFFFAFVVIVGAVVCCVARFFAFFLLPVPHVINKKEWTCKNERKCVFSFFPFDFASIRTRISTEKYDDVHGKQVIFLDLMDVIFCASKLILELNRETAC